MPLPSQSRNQKWATGRAGSHIPKPRPIRPMSKTFAAKREMILTRDKRTCHVCSGIGILIDFRCDRCICGTCLRQVEALKEGQPPS